MPATIVDSNVLIDVLSDDPSWGDWSRAALADAAADGPLVINEVIYAEVSVRYSRIEQLDQELSREDFLRENTPWRASFLAGKAFVDYKRRGGSKRSPLPYFLIGAHAAVRGLRLLTRDPIRYGTYFPTVNLIEPE